LCEIGKAFVECGVSLRAAKIMTVGERAEDVFYITEIGGEALDDDACAELEQRLKARLDQPGAGR
jgi:[protein-PII] uridylyltransferase